MVALLILIGRLHITGDFATGPLMRGLAILGAVVMTRLNFVLLIEVLGRGTRAERLLQRCFSVINLKSVTGN